MKLPFTKNKEKGNYSLLDPDISDTDTEEESVIYNKKFGQVELNLLPRHSKDVKANGTKYSLKFIGLCLAVIILIFSVMSLAFYMGKHFTNDQQNSKIKTVAAVNSTESSSLKDKTNHVKTPNSGSENPETIQISQTPNWSKTYKHSSGEGGVRLFDVDGDGADDIIFGTAGTDLISDVMDVVGINFDDLHRYCELKNFSYPCVGSIVAIRGRDGQELWRFNTRSEVFLTVCNMDLNGDDQLDCISAGRQATVVAFDPRKGEVLWTCEKNEFIMADWNIYQPLALEDWDGDGIRDVLIINGGDPLKEPEEHNRTAGRAIVLSGATGEPLGSRFLEMPDNRESYMSPALYSPQDGSTPYILFGSGGETIPGDLLAMSVEDFCNYIMVDNSSFCPKYAGDPIWGHIEKDKDEYIHIYKGKTKGVMVPPVMVDVNKDGVLDMVLSAYDGAVVLYDGKSLDSLWTANFTGMESYSSPAPGYFDDDDTLDFMVHWCEGAWDDYTGSNATVISGKDGHVIWTLDSAYMQMTSGLTLQTHTPYRDMFVFRVQGRGSLYRWDKEGNIIRHTDSAHKHKRHGGDSFKTPLNNATLNDLLSANISTDEAVSVMYEKHHLTCSDDLSSFSGEVLLIDRSISNNPIRVINMPAEQYYYDIIDKDIEGEKDELLKKLYPDKEIVSSGARTHMSGSFAGDDENTPSQQQNDSLYSKAYKEGGVSPGDDGSNQNPRTKRHLEKTDFSREEQASKLCVVAFYDARTTGAIGDLDGDGTLDYVSVLSLMIPLIDKDFSYHSMDNQIVIQKVNLETGAMDGTLKTIPVSAQTDLIDAENGFNVDQTVGLFRTKANQTWNAFMGKTGNNVY